MKIDKKPFQFTVFGLRKLPLKLPATVERNGLTTTFVLVYHVIILKKDYIEPLNIENMENLFMAGTEKNKSGVISLVGPPNVGKSTLLNALLGQKISIVSPKPQTTRTRILGILNGPGYQLLMLDTPGIHKARSPLNIEMVRIAMETLDDVDAILFMIDVTMQLPTPNRNPAHFLKDIDKPAILLINKIDLVPPEKLLPILETYKEIFPFKSIIPVSALNNDGCDILLKELLPFIPEGPKLYPDDIPTDSTERFIVSEIIREKIFLETREEVPYSTAVIIDRFKEDDRKKMVTIDATIIVEQKSQKGIIIGKKGSMLTKIGSSARHDIETLLAQKVLLKLWVKVQKNWSKNPRMLKELGF